MPRGEQHVVKSVGMDARLGSVEHQRLGSVFSTDT